MEEPGRLQSMGSQRVGHDWAQAFWIVRLLEDWFSSCFTGHSHKVAAVLHAQLVPWKILSMDCHLEWNTLPTWCEELTYWKRPWCWERLKASGKGDDRGWDGWTVSSTLLTWVWRNSRRWWRIGNPGVLQSMGLQRVGHDLATKQQKKTSTFPTLSFSILFWKDNFFLPLNIETTLHFSTCQSQPNYYIQKRVREKTHEINVMKITELLFLHLLLYLGDRSTGITLTYFNSCFKAHSCKELKLVKRKFHFLS